jgi:hypothetical protein
LGGQSLTFHPGTVDSKLGRVQSFAEGTIPTLPQRWVTRPLSSDGIKWARIPVVVIMFFALRGHWGTHYDRPSGPFTLNFWPTFLLFGFFEELIYWVSFTVALGSLAGSIPATVAKRRMRVRVSQSAV